MQMIGAFAQFERSMIVERTRRAPRRKVERVELGPATNSTTSSDARSWSRSSRVRGPPPAARITGVKPATISRELARQQLAWTYDQFGEVRVHVRT
jgi:DNA invertase Pin-like site-specific DNA recombinase